MGELSGVRSVLGTVRQFTVALCHSVVLQAFITSGYFIAQAMTSEDKRPALCLLTKLFIHFVLRTAWLKQQLNLFNRTCASTVTVIL